MKHRIPNVPKMEDRLISGASRPFHVHGWRNRAGSKLVRRFYKAKHGVKASTATQALRWYATWKPSRKATKP